jgi:AGCS family alanine or glycine:cation symporter
LDTIYAIINQINAVVWGPFMLVLILGTGFYLMLGLRFIPLRKLGFGFKQLWLGRIGFGEGEISTFNALMTSLSATIGTGNIAGVAVAIASGGPGALFWMWCTALVGMATKYAESLCAVHYREIDALGNYVGGPMYYIKNGLSRRWLWLGTAFAVFGTIAGFGIGNAVQANSVAIALNQQFGFSVVTVGWVMAVIVGVVLIGGVRWIAQVSGKLVPFMAFFYVISGLIILFIHIDKIPMAFALIIEHAFTPVAAGGGFAGASVAAAIRFGVARGIFSNEAGLGSAPIAHAAAKTNSPVLQGTVAMLGTFIDTIIVCSITGLVIVVSGTWMEGKTSVELSTDAFNQALPVIGGYVVSLGLVLFAFTTILGWSVYGERCAEYLFGEQVILPFRILWVLMVPIGAIVHDNLNIVWLISDTLNAMMAIPNLIALLLLSPVIFTLTKQHFNKADSSDKNNMN